MRQSEQQKEVFWHWIMGVGLIVMLIIRAMCPLSPELDVDTSTWISSAISAAHSDRPLWTLLNYCDSRPLTVLPLAWVEMAGIEVSWALANFVGVVLWAGTLLFFFFVLRHWFSSRESFWFTFPLLVFQTGNNWFGFISYNSEHPAVFMLMVGVWLVLKLREPSRSAWQYAGVGIWLGLLPFVKIQIVPMGLVLAAFAAWGAIASRQWLNLLMLLMGGLLPLAVINGYYYQNDSIESFWNDYFWNYYYYSFTTIHSEAEISSRFGPRTLARAFVRPVTTRVFWWVQVSLITIGALYGVRRHRTVKTAFPLEVLLLVGAFGAVSLYAVLQAGNPFDHYLLLAFVPASLSVAFLSVYVPAGLFKKIGLVSLLLISLEGIRNLIFFPYQPVPSKYSWDDELIQIIKQNTRKGDKMTIWGYADRLFVETRLPAGNRLPHSYWIYTESPLQSYRQQQFISDLDENKPALLVDAMVDNVSDVYLPHKEQYRHDRFPVIKAYVQKNYVLVDSLHGVWFYRRKQR